MKLNSKQICHIIGFLYSNKFISDYNFAQDLSAMGELFDEEIKEARIIRKYGMAGKLWNNSNRIYITGHNDSELATMEKFHQKQEPIEIEMANSNIAQIIEMYKDPVEGGFKR